MWVVKAFTYVLSVAHATTACFMIGVGVASTLDAEIWMAHRVAPLWSGGFVSILV